MLDCKILQIGHGITYGSVSLKSLQNDNIPELDLLVREAIQNSSDASINENGDSYSVNFTTGEFVPEEFNLFMTGAEDILDKKYPRDRANFLEIRDTGTSGLTGCIRLSEINEDDHGNFFKLIFDTGKRQTNSIAGGNWGFGKSVYYRVGIGIVIYYSRIKTNDDYEDRLIITLIEDENKKDINGKDATILNSVKTRYAGRAWWGIEDGEDLLPLTDNETIQSVLDVFGLKQFKPGETGTSIIIPYIDTENLLSGIIPIVDAEIREDVKEYFIKVFASDISDYLNLSIQRWYAPKIHNRELKKLGLKWLRVSVNDNFITKDKMIPFFQLVQELYNTALFKTYGYTYSSSEFSQIETHDINIRSYFDSGMRAGYIAVIEISKTEINGADSGLSPYDYIGEFEDDGGLNEPIVMYTRDLGMIINYETEGLWVKNLTPPNNLDEYLCAFFVPDTKKIIKKDLKVEEYAGMRLGEYLRECETSDHMNWNDPVKMQIVQRIQKNTINKINEQFKDKSQEDIEATASKLSNKLGKSLLPRIGYGKKKTGGNGGTGTGSEGTKHYNIEFFIKDLYFEENCAIVKFTLKLMHHKESACLSLMIASEAGWIDAKSWEDDIGTPFPVQIVNCHIDTVKTTVLSEPYYVDLGCSEDCNEIQTNEISMKILPETDKMVNTQLKITSYIQDPEIEGEILLHPHDKKYQFSFRVE